MSPTQLTLREMRKRGYLCEVVEKTMPKTFIKKDLFGFIDVVCVGHGHTVAVQVTSASNLADREKKARASEHLPILLEAGWTILCHGWRQAGGKKGSRWILNEREITLQDNVRGAMGTL